MTILGAIADDFTGATDLAGILARSGTRVRLHTGLPVDHPVDNAPFEVIALKIRTAPVEEAVEQARAALRWLQQAGATRIYWKYCSTFDSTAQGNIGPVAEALMRDLGAEQTIFCPAFPENGRRVFMGNLFVHQQPLAESPMKDHPLTPMRDSNLLRLLASQVSRPVGLADRPTLPNLAARLVSLKEEGVAHVVTDAVDDTDLEVIAKACRNMPLLTGGSALAMSLPALYAADGLLSLNSTRTKPSLSGTGAVILSGSASAMTNRQVAHRLPLAPSFRLDPLVLAEKGPGAALDWLAAQDLSLAPLIYATTDPETVRAAQSALGTERAGALVEQALAACASHARDLGASRIVVAGGETSGAVTQALEVTQLDIGPEIAPGVPWCFCRSEGKDIALALKSGNFGTESFFSDALALLETI